MQRRVQVVGGLLIAAALVGIGIYPVRRGLTVRYRPTAAKRPVRRSRRRRLKRMLLWWW